VRVKYYRFVVIARGRAPGAFFCDLSHRFSRPRDEMNTDATDLRAAISKQHT
jgi:hypothetical protein